jgi:hypothetical protein
MLKGVLLGVILFLLLGGLATIKIAAALEVSKGERARFLQALVWTGWLKGDTRRAVVLRRLALAWVVVLVLAWFAVALFMNA